MEWASLRLHRHSVACPSLENRCLVDTPSRQPLCCTCPNAVRSASHREIYMSSMPVTSKD